MALNDADVTAVEAAWSTSDLEALAVAGARVGLAIEPEVGRMLCQRSFRQLSARELFATILRAVVEPVGIAVHLGALGIGVDLVCVAVRTDTHVVVGLRSVRGGPSDAWPSLRPWFKQLSRNHERCQRWARTIAPDRLAIPLAEQRPRQAVTEEELLAQLAAQPDDEAVRMVLADLLLETGDPRGELMRLATSSSPEDRERAGELERRHGTRLAGELAQLATSYTLAGGFVDRVVMTAATFRRHGDRLFRAQPIRHLSIAPFTSKALATFTAAPHTALVRELYLEASDLRAAPAMAALGDADLARLESLTLEGVVLAGADGEQAMANLRAPRLRVLEIARGRFELAALAGLARNLPVTSSLERLWLRPTDGGSTTSLTPFANLALPNLRQLVIEHCRFVLDAHVAALIPRAPRLERVSVEGVGDLTCGALSACRELRDLVIHRRISLDTLDGLLALPRLERIAFRHELSPARPYVERLLALPATHALRSVGISSALHAELRGRFLCFDPL